MLTKFFFLNRYYNQRSNQRSNQVSEVETVLLYTSCNKKKESASELETVLLCETESPARNYCPWK